MTAPATWLAELATPRLLTESEVNEIDIHARRRREALQIFERSLPTLYRWPRLDHPLLTKRVKVSSLPADPPHAKRVVFFGPPGAGKTSLAIALLRAMLERELSAATLSCDDDGQRIVRRYKFAHAHLIGVARIDGPAGGVRLQAAIRAPVLLLDNFGADAKINSNAVPEVIIERHAEERTTWITTEYEPEWIAKRYEGGIARRLYEHAHVLRFGGAPRSAISTP